MTVAEAAAGRRIGGVSAPVSALLAAHIRDIADYPKPGVVFKDITPLLADAASFAAAVTALAAPWQVAPGAAAAVDVVAGVEARGFILAAPVATALHAGFVPVRKKGRLPGPTYHADYALEYGEGTVEVHRDAVTPGQRVLVVDDVLATGGTVSATIELLRRAGAQVTCVSVLMELTALGGARRLPDVRLDALLSV